MRLFHQLVIDDYLSDTALKAAPGYWQAPLGAVDDIRFTAVVTSVAGTSPTLLLFANDTPDLMDTHGVGLITIFPTASLSVGQSTILSGSFSSSGGAPGSYGYRLWYQLGGSGSPRAHVRVWATGRGTP